MHCHHYDASPARRLQDNGLRCKPYSIAINPIQARPAQEVAAELIRCLMVKRQVGGELLRGVIVETVAYCQCVAEGF